MDERRRLVLTIIASLAALFFLSTHFYLPFAKSNAKRRAQYRQLKVEVKTIGELSKDGLDSLGKRIDTAISNLESKFPPEGKLRLTEELTMVPKGSNIVFTEITHRKMQEGQGYQVFPVDVNMKTTFYDLIKYLTAIEASPLLIGVNSLSLHKVEPEAKHLDIKVTFFGFKLIRQFPAISKYVEGRYGPLSKQRLERLFEPVKLMDSESAVSRLAYYNPFVYDFEKPDAYPERETINIENLSLKGILRIGDEKAALINDTVVKEGERIGGVQVVEIEDYRVILMQSGKRYILKIGVDDGFIKP